MSSSEQILGEFSAVAPLTIGSEHLRFILTDRRIIVARVGKRGLGSMGAFSLLGKLTAGVEDALKSGKETVAKRGQKEFTAQEILDGNRDNFAILYNDVVSVDVQQTPKLTRLNFLTKQDKFELQTRTIVDVVQAVLEKTLREKLTITRMPQGPYKK